ncbi:MAG: hypothetical protein WBH40_01685 [Ignavibacteriaceae bacterium]|jgi:hypothetical protein
MFIRIFHGHDPNYQSFFSPEVLKRNNLVLLTCLIILSLIIIAGVSSLEFDKKTMKKLS